MHKRCRQRCGPLWFPWLGLKLLMSRRLKINCRGTEHGTNLEPNSKLWQTCRMPQLHVETWQEVCNGYVRLEHTDSGVQGVVLIPGLGSILFLIITNSQLTSGFDFVKR